MSAAKKTTKADYMRLIGEVDLLLAVVTGMRADAKTEAERAKHTEQLDMLLDERYTLMQSRDLLS